MKKYLLIFGCLSALALAGCTNSSKEDLDNFKDDVQEDKTLVKHTQTIEIDNQENQFLLDSLVAEGEKTLAGVSEDFANFKVENGDKVYYMWAKPDKFVIITEDNPEEHFLLDDGDEIISLLESEV